MKGHKYECICPKCGKYHIHPRGFTGKTFAEETKKLLNRHKGEPLSEEHKRKISLKRKGIPVSEETRRKMSESKEGGSPWNLGKRVPHPKDCKCPFCIGISGDKNPAKREDVRIKLRESHVNNNLFLEKNPAWRGGVSFEPYSPEFNDGLRENIKKRDNYNCAECGLTEEENLKRFKKGLIIHHIDFNKKNNNEINLITLCHKCHAKIPRKYP